MPLPSRQGVRTSSMRAWLAECGADLATCLRFFTRLPAPAALGSAPFGRAIRLLPVAGLAVGACAAVPLALGAAAGLPAPMPAVLAVAAGLLVSGGLHEDGLADTADGLGGGASKERKLAIMRDSRIGTYGVLALAVALLWRVAALSAIIDQASTGSAVAVLLGSAALSRAMALLPLALLPPARDDGLGRGVGTLDNGALALCLLVAAVCGIALPVAGGITLGHAIVGSGLAPLASAMIVALARRQIGGHTGDVAGASQQAAEAAYLGGLLLFPPLAS